MSTAKFFLKTILVGVSLLAGGIAYAQQVQVSGTVYERTGRLGMASVSVRSTSGAGTITDSLGRYSIRIPQTDSLSFSYQGKATQKIPVKTIPPNRPFDMKIHVDVTTLPMVEVQEKRTSYQLDSLANREEYRRVFDYNPEYISTVGGGVGFNIDALLSMRKIKRMEKFKAYLEELEREKYVDHRFNKSLVKRLTGLESPALDTFMVQYRPSYEFILGFDTEYDYYKYIRDSGSFFEQQWRRDH